MAQEPIGNTLSSDESREPVLLFCRAAIRAAVRVLAILMTLVIMLGVVDVAWMLLKHLHNSPRFVLTISDILATFGAFMAVLIAIEIFQNIVLYLRDDVLHVKIVMATALMAIARKVIILDFNELAPSYIYATAAVVLASAVGYWIVHNTPTKHRHEDDSHK